MRQMRSVCVRGAMAGPPACQKSAQGIDQISPCTYGPPWLCATQLREQPLFKRAHSSAGRASDF